MKTIEDLKIEKTFYKREKDLYGNVTREPYQAFVKRPIVIVTPGTRFLYHIIDAVILGLFNFLVNLMFESVLNTQIAYQYSEIFYSFNLVSLLFSFAFYAIFESTLQATPGKLILGYTVIDEYAQKPDASKILLRTIIRWVPFEGFSCLGDRGWHDKWSKTYVVKKSERDALQKLLGNEISSNEDLLD